MATHPALTSLATALFWVSVFLLVYAYFLYPLVLWLVGRARRFQPAQKEFLPTLSITLSAHNEEKTIARKLENLLALDYPQEKLEILVGSDGSTDRTVEIVERYRSRGVQLLALPRVGKATVDNALIEQARGEIVVTTDVAGQFDPSFAREVVKPFADPRVGGVTGVWEQTGIETATAYSENRYWRYETWVRGLESRAGFLVAVTGACLAFRKQLYRPIRPYSDTDNLVPLLVALAGYRTVQQATAVLYEEPVDNPKTELRNRIRTVTRSLRDYLSVPALLSPWRYPGPCLAIVSHKLLRWWTPFFLLLILVSSALLASVPFYAWLFVGQLAGYGAAVVGLALEKFWRLPRPWALLTNGVVVSLAFVVGTFNVLRGKTIYQW